MLKPTEFIDMSIYELWGFLAANSGQKTEVSTVLRDDGKRMIRVWLPKPGPREAA